MNTPASLTIYLKDAIRSQNRRQVDELVKHPAYASLSSAQLNEALEIVTPVLYDQELLNKILLHASFDQLSAKTIGNLMIIAIREGSSEQLSLFLDHSALKDIPLEDAEKIVLEALDFQGKELVSNLMLFSSFRAAFDKHVEAAAHCAIRTKNREWMEQLFAHPEYNAIAPIVFPAAIKWALKRKDKKLINLSIRSIHFDAVRESDLRQAIFDSVLEVGPDGTREIDYYIIKQLIKHPDYLQLSSFTLSWMLAKAIELKDMPLLIHFFHHPNYINLTPDALTTLIVQALSLPDWRLQERLMRHPQFNSLDGPNLGLVLEEAVRLHRQESLPELLKHPHFEQIPEDSFKRMAVMQAQTADSELKKFLDEPLFKHKYGQMIYEAIRRNESHLIDQFFRNNTLKEEVVNQLINYAASDELFVSQYIIRDVLREAFLTRDPVLIERLTRLSLFQSRIKELFEQAIQFDDEELIESALLSDFLKEKFYIALAGATKEDKKRLYLLFASDPFFKQKPLSFIQEIQSWNPGIQA